MSYRIDYQENSIWLHTEDVHNNSAMSVSCQKDHGLPAGIEGDADPSSWAMSCACLESVWHGKSCLDSLEAQGQLAHRQ